MLSANFVFGQKSQLLIAQNTVGKLQSSIDRKEDIKKQISIVGEGIKSLDAALKDKKTKKYPETWALQAYFSSYLALIETNEANAQKYFNLAQIALDTAKLLDKFQSNTQLIDAAINNINVHKLREGLKAIDRNDFYTAFYSLKDVSDYKPKDTSLALNVANSAQKIQANEQFLFYLERARHAGIKNPIVFQELADLYAFKFDYQSALKVLEDGLKFNPYHPFLMNDYINLLLDNEKYDLAVEAIAKTFSQERRSTRLLYYLYGYLQQTEVQNLDRAEEAYQKALDYDANYFEAYYQLALVYIQSANRALKDKNTAKYNSYINRAELTLLRANEININDINTIQLLIEIYERKNRLDLVQELRRRIKEF